MDRWDRPPSTSSRAASDEHAGGRLCLSGVDPRVAEQIQRNGLIGAGALTVAQATQILGESTRYALTAGSTWLREGTPPPG